MASAREGRIEKRRATVAAAAAAKAIKAAAKEAELAAQEAELAVRAMPKNAVLRAKVASYTEPWSMLTIAYGDHRGKLFTEEEDRFLFCTTAELGYEKLL